MSQEKKLAHEHINTVFTKIGRGERVFKDDAEKARQYYNSMATELKSLSFVVQLEKESGVQIPKILKENQDLKYQNKLLAHENEHYSKNVTKSAAESNTSSELKRENGELKKENESLKTKLNASETSPSGTPTINYVTWKFNTKGAAQLTISIELKGEHEALKKENESLKIKLKAFETGSSSKPATKYSTESSNTNHEQGQSKAIEKLKDQMQKQAEENGRLKEQINELKNRLSMLAGQKLSEGNPDITDLSDVYRPTKLAEKVNQIYDDEWTQAFEELEQKVTKNEEKQIDILANLTKEVDTFCTTTQQKQLEQLKNITTRQILEPLYGTDRSVQNQLSNQPIDGMNETEEDLTIKQLKTFRKSFGILSTHSLKQEFYKIHLSQLTWENKRLSELRSLHDFVEKLLEVVWMMKMQDPLMEFAWCERGTDFNGNRFTPYTRRGKTISQCVWPVMLLHKDGPVVAKGVAQCK